MDVSKRVLEHYNEAQEYFNENNIVGIFLQGSQNYGLETNHSDVDTKLIVTPTLNEIVLNSKPYSTTHVRENDEHIDFKDIRLMLGTFRKQNINFLEILFTKYKIINPMYEDIWNELEKERETIAHYNIYSAVKAMKGMAYEKHHALEHRYPAKIEIIDKYGYDPKQLSHLIRINEFLYRYINGESYEDCLISKQQKWIINVKLGLYNLEVARALADELIKIIDEMCEPFTKDSEYNGCNKKVEELLDWAQYEIVKRSLVRELER